MRLKIFYILFLLIIPAELFGQWTRSKGEIYGKLNQWWVIYDSYYDENGSTNRFDRTRSMGNTSLYLEYGITERFTSIVYFPFFSKSTLYELKSTNTGTIIKEGDAISSIGDANITVKYGFPFQKLISLSISLSLGVPFGISEGGYDGSLQTGDGEFNQELRMAIGQSINMESYYPYYSIYAGFNNRTNGFSDEFRYGLEIGSTFSKITIIIKLQNCLSLNNGKASESLFNQVAAANNTEYVILAPELGVHTSKSTGISLSYQKALKGKYYFRNPSFSIGFYVYLNKK